MGNQVGPLDGLAPARLLGAGEQLLVNAPVGHGLLLVTDRRLAVSLSGDRFELDIPFDGLRRIQLDFERVRPATMAIVPEHPSDAPIVLAVKPEQYEAVSEAMMVVGRLLNGIPLEERDRINVADGDGSMKPE